MPSASPATTPPPACSPWGIGVAAKITPKPSYLVRTLLSPRWQWLRRLVGGWFLDGDAKTHWLRQVMNRETTRIVDSLNPGKLNALELSGDNWDRPGLFKSYTSAGYPKYDVCAGPMPDTFDLILAEQVFEHLLWPYRAGKSVYAMLRPGGYFLVTVPFLVRIHPDPVDCTRWTETGLKYLLAECGFPLDGVVTGSWGNRACVKSNLNHFSTYRWWHSLTNEPLYPLTVWALARK